MVIAIDGTSSSGKSTIARELGKRLGINVIGTGSIYRAIALKVINLSIPLDNDERIRQMLETTTIDCGMRNGVSYLVLDGIDQDYAVLNNQQVSMLSAEVSQKPYVREFVRGIQRRYAENNTHIIVEGRDIGSIVFPDAQIKLFIDADIKTRAQRRLHDYKQNHQEATLSSIMEQLQQRDDEDRQRDISPLIMTSDAILIDTSSKTVQECVDEIIRIITDKTSK